MTAPAARLPLHEILLQHAALRAAIRRRLDEFARVPPSDYFYEAAYCLLTPQSSASNAEAAVEKLRGAGFLVRGDDPEPILSDRSHYIRFHRTKARHLLAFRESYPLVKSRLTAGESAPDLRAWLVANVRGMGWKEASHLLRNIGHRNLAILDRHILKNLRRAGVLRSLPAALTPKRYASIERRFRRFSEKIGVPLDELDLLFWSMETGEIRK